jgi:hypothetical protein
MFFFIKLIYNKEMLLGIISKLYKTQGTNTINATTRGSNTVQQKDINWSKRILGKEALAHINVKIIAHDFKPNDKLYSNPSIIGLENKFSLFKLFI